MREREKNSEGRKREGEGGEECVFFKETETTEIYTLSLHDALTISIDFALSWTLTGAFRADSKTTLT